MKSQEEFIDGSDLQLTLTPTQREALLRAAEFKKNPTDMNSEYVCQMMDQLYEIKLALKRITDAQKQLDELVKFSIRCNAQRKEVQQFFKVSPASCRHKINKPVEMMKRLMEIFEDPMDFASCIEFNYKNLLDLMGNTFIEENSDLITQTESQAAVSFK